MKKLLKRITSNILCTTLVFTGFVVSPVYAKDNTIKAFIVGDSTSCIYGSDDDYALPRAGWGMYLQNYLNKDIKVVNLALAGRSSKSFTTEDNYKTLLSDMKKGDYLIIQFGHNDEKNTKEEDILTRYTNPDGDKDTEGSFKYSLYNYYIKPAEEKGVKPILLSPVSRRKFDEDKHIKDTHANYDDAVIELAIELDIPFIDMTTVTADYYNKLGVEETKSMHALYNDRNKGEVGYDNTHFSHFGARTIAGLFTKELKNIDSNIKNYIDASVIDSDNNTQIKRDEFTSMLIRLLSESETIEDNFNDITPENPYYNAIGIAKKLGISIGDINDNFNPEMFLTRQEMFVLTERALRKYNVLENKKQNIIEELTDYNTISEYAKASIEIMFENGFDIQKNNCIMPNEVVKRSEAATFMYKIYDLLSSNIETNTSNQSIDDLEKVENTK